MTVREILKNLEAANDAAKNLGFSVEGQTEVTVCDQEGKTHTLSVFSSGEQTEVELRDQEGKIEWWG